MENSSSGKKETQDGKDKGRQRRKSRSRSRRKSRSRSRHYDSRREKRVAVARQLTSEMPPLKGSATPKPPQPSAPQA